MDKLKQVFSSGSNKEEQHSGQGSHLHSGSPTSGVGSTSVGNQASNFDQSTTGTDPLAAGAARTAWSSHNQGVPGTFPEDDGSNPYAAANIDPRVDKVPRTEHSSRGTAPTTSTTGSSLGGSSGIAPTSSSSGSALGQGSSQPTGFNQYGTSERSSGPTSGFNEHSLGNSAGTSAGLNGGSALRQPDSSSRFGQSETGVGSSGLGNTTTSDSSAPIRALAGDETSGSNNPSFLASTLGALGLGGAAATASHGSDRTTAAPSTTTGVDSYTSSAQSGPTHHRKESIPTTAYPSGTLDSPRASAPPTASQASGNSTAIADEPSYGDTTGRAAIGSTSTYKSTYLGSGEPTSSVIDPMSSDPNTYRKPETSHLGRDAGIGAGVGAAGIGAASAYDGSRGQTGFSESHTGLSGNQTGLSSGQTGLSGGHSGLSGGSSGLSGSQTGLSGGQTGLSSGQTGLSGGHSGLSSGQAGLSGAHTSSTGNTEHTPFYDAATAPVHQSGTSTSGIGGPTISRGYGLEPGTTSSAVGGAGTSQGYGSTAGREFETTPSAVGGTGASQGYGTTSGTSQGYGSSAGRQHDTTSSAVGGTGASQGYGSSSDRHTGRDAAALGAGTGALGAGAYEFEKHLDSRAPTTGERFDQSAPQGYSSTSDYPGGTSQGYGSNTSHHTTSQGSSATTGQTDDRHLGRDAAIGGAGAGAVGAGAYEHSKHDSDKAEKQHLKEMEKEQKHQHSKLEKSEKQHEKAIEKEEKQHEKAERQHEKAIEKDEKKHDKEVAKEEKHHHGGAAAGVGAAGATGAGAYEYEKHHDESQEHAKKPSIIQRILHPNQNKAQEPQATSGLAAADAADQRAYSEHGDASARQDSTAAQGYPTQTTGVQGGQYGAESGRNAGGLGHNDTYGSSGVSGGQYGADSGRTAGGLGQNDTYGSSGMTGGTTSTGLASGHSGQYGTTGTGLAGNTTGTGLAHEGGLQQGHLTRESMPGQQGPSDKFGELMDHSR